MPWTQNGRAEGELQAGLWWNTVQQHKLFTYTPIISMMIEKPGQVQACRQAPYAVESSLKGADTSPGPNTGHIHFCLFLLMNVKMRKRENCHHAAQLHTAVCQNARIEASSPAEDLGC